MAIHEPIHPGEILREIIIESAGLTVTEASEKLRVDRTTLSRLLNGRAGISPDMALRLSLFLPNTDMTFWLNLQRDYDIYRTSRKGIKGKIKPIDVDDAA